MTKHYCKLCATLIKPGKHSQFNGKIVHCSKCNNSFCENCLLEFEEVYNEIYDEYLVSDEYINNEIDYYYVNICNLLNIKH